MTQTRREQILSSLRAGHLIRRVWKGSDGHGYISHQLAGINRLREVEVEQLRDEGLVEDCDAVRAVGGFAPLRLKTEASPRRGRAVDGE